MNDRYFIIMCLCDIIFEQVISSLSNGGPHVAAAHVTHPSLHQHLHRQNAGGGGPTGLRQEQHHMHTMHPHQMDATPSPAHLATPPALVDPSVGGGMDHHISADSMITTANTASPPNHIRNMLLNQHHQQSGIGKGGGGGMIPGANPILMGHQSPVPPPHHGGQHTPPLGGGGVGVDMHSQASLSRLNSSDHSASHNSSNSSSVGGMLHSQPPVSPVTPPSENPPSVHNYGNWAYQSQPSSHLLLGGNETYGMPLLPPMPATTPTTQNHNFFKGSF